MSTAVLVDYIDHHRDRFGVEPICRVLRRAGMQIAPSSHYAANYGVYGSTASGRVLSRVRGVGEAYPVARKR